MGIVIIMSQVREGGRRRIAFSSHRTDLRYNNNINTIQPN
jgi:hypothetical protein